MTSFLVNVSLLLAAASLGLRITSMLLSAQLNAFVRLSIALVIGGALVVWLLRLSGSYDIYDLGLGLFVSLAPVGAYDLTKWWLRRRQTS